LTMVDSPDFAGFGRFSSQPRALPIVNLVITDQLLFGKDLCWRQIRRAKHLDIAMCM
jgi:hypothetical protein